MSTQTWLREVRRLLDGLGVTYSVTMGSRHAKFWIEKNGRKGMVTVALSPSRNCALYDVQKDVKRQLGLVGTKEPN